MTNISQQRKALTERILDGAGTAPQSERQAAFEKMPDLRNRRLEC